MSQLAAGLVLVLALTSCSGHRSGTTTGHAFEHQFATQVGAKPIAPGDRVGFLQLFLRNVTAKPLTLESVQVSGPGVGEVVRVAQVQAAPLGSDRLTAAPGAIYTTDPPAMWFTDGCHVQQLRPIAGYVLAPNAAMRIWVVFQGESPGSFRVPDNVVFYRQGGASYRQVIPMTYYGGVTMSARTPVMDWSERRCLRYTQPLNPSR